jgi:hypothetical protein
MLSADRYIAGKTCDAATAFFSFYAFPFYILCRFSRGITAINDFLREKPLAHIKTS